MGLESMSLKLVSARTLGMCASLMESQLFACLLPSFSFSFSSFNINRLNQEREAEKKALSFPNKEAMRHWQTDYAKALQKSVLYMNMEEKQVLESVVRILYMQKQSWLDMPYLGDD